MISKKGISEVWLGMAILETKHGEDLTLHVKHASKAFPFLGRKTGTTLLKRHVEECRDKRAKTKKMSGPNSVLLQ